MPTHAPACSAPGCARRRTISRARAGSSAHGRLEEAVAEYQLAAELNPDNRDIAEELEQTQNLLRAKVPVNRDGKTELEALVERMRDQRLPGLDVAAEPLPDELDASATPATRSSSARWRRWRK